MDEDETNWLQDIQHESDKIQTVSGWVYMNLWKLQPDLSIQYAIRFDTSRPELGHTVQVPDVFVNLDEVIKLLTSVSGQVKVKPPNIKTISTNCRNMF